jgi:two-component system, NarL family, sensor histidine kinase DesK
MTHMASAGKFAAGGTFAPRVLARVAVWMFVIVLTAFTAQMVTQDPAVRALIAALSALFLGWEALSSRLGAWGVLPGLVIFGGGMFWNWHLPTSLGIAVIALALPRRWAAVGVAGLVTFTIWQWASSPLYTSDLVFRGAMGLAQNVLFIYLLERACRSGKEIEKTQDELAQLEVDTERARLAGELNKVIGSTLDRAGAQASDLQRQVTSDHPEVAKQLVEIEGLIARGQDQLSLLSYEPVLDDFESEVRTARSLCRNLGVEFIATLEEVDDRVEEVFALMLRESTTNMFKHAMPTRCTAIARMEDGEAVFGFTNDGVRDPSRSTVSGSGHRRWRAELAALGGSLRTATLDGGRFQVLARVPLTPAVNVQSQPSQPMKHASEEFSHG